jgi:hypothetical protein
MYGPREYPPRHVTPRVGVYQWVWRWAWVGLSWHVCASVRARACPCPDDSGHVRTGFPSYPPLRPINTQTSQRSPHPYWSGSAERGHAYTLLAVAPALLEYCIPPVSDVPSALGGTLLVAMQYILRDIYIHLHTLTLPSLPLCRCTHPLSCSSSTNLAISSLFFVVILPISVILGAGECERVSGSVHMHVHPCAC